MRILHTGDWHLGRIFYAHHLTDDQAYVLEEQFFKLLKAAKIDVVVIAGDVFDRAVPPVEAVALWDMVITKLAKDYKIPALVIGGNHDSAERLDMGRDLYSDSGVHVWLWQNCFLSHAFCGATYAADSFVGDHIG